MSCSLHNLKPSIRATFIFRNTNQNSRLWNRFERPRITQFSATLVGLGKDWLSRFRIAQRLPLDEVGNAPLSVAYRRVSISVRYHRPRRGLLRLFVFSQSQGKTAAQKKRST